MKPEPNQPPEAARASAGLRIEPKSRVRADRPLGRSAIFSLALLAAASVAGCAGSPDRAPFALDAQTTDLVRTLKAPGYGPEVFAESLPAVFRVVVLQAAQFHQAEGRWPASQSELREHLGTPAAQPYRLKTQSDGSLVIGWETIDGSWAPVVRLTPDYIVSYSLMPSLEAANAVRTKKAQDEARGEALGAGVAAGLRGK